MRDKHYAKVVETSLVFWILSYFIYAFLVGVRTEEIYDHIPCLLIYLPIAFIPCSAALASANWFLLSILLMALPVFLHWMPIEDGVRIKDTVLLCLIALGTCLMLYSVKEAYMEKYGTKEERKEEKERSSSKRKDRNPPVREINKRQGGKVIELFPRS